MTIRKLYEIVREADPKKPSTSVIKAAELILARAQGEPVSELERMTFDLTQNDLRWSFNMSDETPRPRSSSPPT